MCKTQSLPSSLPHSLPPSTPCLPTSLTADQTWGGHVWKSHNLWGMYRPRLHRPHLWMVHLATKVRSDGEGGREVESSKYRKVDVWNGIKHICRYSPVLQATNSYLPLHRCTRQVNCPLVGGIPLEWQTSVSQCPAITRADPPVVFFPQLTVR